MEAKEAKNEIPFRGIKDVYLPKCDMNKEFPL